MRISTSLFSALFIIAVMWGVYHVPALKSFVGA